MHKNVLEYVYLTIVQILAWFLYQLYWCTSIFSDTTNTYGISKNQTKRSYQILCELDCGWMRIEMVNRMDNKQNEWKIKIFDGNKYEYITIKY